MGGDYLEKKLRINLIEEVEAQQSYRESRASVSLLCYYKLHFHHHYSHFDTYVVSHYKNLTLKRNRGDRIKKVMAALPVPGLRTGMAAPSPEFPSILRDPSRVSAMLEKASRVLGCTERAGDPQQGHPAQGEGAPMVQGRAEQGLSGAAKGGVLLPPRILQLLSVEGRVPCSSHRTRETPMGKRQFSTPARL